MPNSLFGFKNKVINVSDLFGIKLKFKKLKIICIFKPFIFSAEATIVDALHKVSKIISFFFHLSVLPRIQPEFLKR